jgi:hypothetical protein
MSDYLHGVEMSLAAEAMVSLGFSPAQLRASRDLMNRFHAEGWESREDSLPECVWSAIWGDCRDEVTAYYLEAHAYLRDLDFRQRRKCLEEEVVGLEKELILAYNAL